MGALDDQGSIEAWWVPKVSQSTFVHWSPRGGDLVYV